MGTKGTRTKKLSDAWLRRLPVKKGKLNLAGETVPLPTIVWDSMQVSLGIKLQPSGARVWVSQLHFGGKGRTKRELGFYPALGLAAARAKAAAWRDLVQEGKDPREEAAKAKEAEAERRRQEAMQRANTFSSFAESFIARRTNRRALLDAREIRRVLIKEWGEKPIAEITPRDVRQLIVSVAARAPYEARNCWGHAVQIFRTAVFEEVIAVSPCASLDKRMLFANVRIEHRQRVLSDSELAAFWTASDPLGVPYGPFYRLLLLTGVRIGELVGARWSELHPELRRVIRDAKGQPVDWTQVDDAVKVWSVPRERFKMDAEHVVTLSNDACAILATMPRFADGDHVFTTTFGKKAINGFSVAKRRLDELMLTALTAAAERRGEDAKDVTLPPWINHDLRRVVRTNMAALGIADHVAEAAIGHSRQGIQRIYDQHRYLPEVRLAFEMWASRLREIVDLKPAPQPGNVVRLKRRGAR